MNIVTIPGISIHYKKSNHKILINYHITHRERHHVFSLRPSPQKKTPSGTSYIYTAVRVHIPSCTGLIIYLKRKKKHHPKKYHHHHSSKKNIGHVHVRRVLMDCSD